MIILVSILVIFKQRDTEPQRAEIELKMQKEESASAEVPGRTKWIIEGIKLQEEQYVHVSL